MLCEVTDLADSRHFEDERRVTDMRATRASYVGASGVRARSDFVNVSETLVDALRGD